MRIICLFFFLVSNNCFSQPGNGIGDTLALDGSVTLHIRYTPGLAGTKVKLGTYHSFPENDVSTTTDTLRAGKEDIWIKSPVRSVGTSFLTVGDSTLTVLAVPGDTIQLDLSELGSGQSKRVQVLFSGRYKSIQEYYAAKCRQSPGPIQHCMNAGMSARDLTSFRKIIDSTYQEIDSFWTGYRTAHHLPAWFIEYETNSIRYSDAWLRLYMVWYQIHYQKKLQTVTPDYYVFMNRIVVENEKAMIQYDYNRFLRQYIYWKMMSSKETESGPVSFARKELGGNLGELFEIWG